MHDTGLAPKRVVPRQHLPCCATQGGSAIGQRPARDDSMASVAFRWVAHQVASAGLRSIHATRKHVRYLMIEHFRAYNSQGRNNARPMILQLHVREQRCPCAAIHAQLSRRVFSTRCPAIRSRGCPAIRSRGAPPSPRPGRARAQRWRKLFTQHSNLLTGF